MAHDLKVGDHLEWRQQTLASHQTYTRARFEDMPEVRDCVWTDV